MPYRIKNWEKFQHYKSGRGAPPWIKLYRGILNDKEWFALDPAAAKFLVSLWVLAAETDGELPDSETIAFRLRLASKDVSKFITLCSHWIITDASKLLADCYQVATPETETETETDSSEAKASSPRARAENEFPCPEGVDQIDWQSLLANRKQQRAPMNAGAYRQILQKLERWSRDGWPPGPIVAYAVERGWRTVFETDEMKHGNAQHHIGKPRQTSDGGRASGWLS